MCASFNIRFFFFCYADGDENKEDIRRGVIGANDAGGRQKLLRTIWPGKQEIFIQSYGHFTVNYLFP